MHNTAIALITYNRPSHTASVLKALREHSIQNLYIFSDAPKNDAAEPAVKKVRRLIHSVDWTTPTIITQSANQGLAKSIFGAVDKVFEEYERIILLEDDCVPQRHFFDYMKDCLNRYADCQRVFGISGYSVPIPQYLLKSYKSDIYFFPRIGSWGWATWRRAWKHLERDLEAAYHKACQQGVDLSQGGTDVPVMLKSMLEGKLNDVWSLNWMLSMFLHKGLYVYPTRSHIDNIGMDGSGVHCSTTTKFDTVMSNVSPSIFPEKVAVDNQLSQNFRKFYDIPVPNFLKTNSKKNRQLKVVSISTSDFGGAGKAAIRIHQGLLSNELDATMLVLNTARKEPHIKALPRATKNGPEVSALSISKDFNETRKLYQHWRLLMHQFPSRPEGLELFSDSTTRVDLCRIREVAEADIIHLHWVAGILNYSELPTSLFNKPVVWTLHDMNPFTGGCHYTGKCSKYENQCGACPQLGSAIEKDLSHLIWLEKQVGYQNIDLTVVTPSKWLGDCVKRSQLLKKFPLRIIPNGLPTNIFQPNSGNKLRKQYKIADADQIVLFGAANVTIQRKGFQYLLKALQKLNTDLTFNRKLHLFVFGNLPDKLQVDFPYPLVSVGHINNENFLSELYSVADVFVTPSTEDNLPNTAIEALACGTPIVAFDTGGLSEIITHLQTGYLAPKDNTDQLAEGIRWTLDSIQNSNAMRNQCRADALAKYDQIKQAKAYKELYLEIIGRRAKDQSNFSPKTIVANFQTNEFPSTHQADARDKSISSAQVDHFDEASSNHKLGEKYYYSEKYEKALLHFSHAVALDRSNDLYLKSIADLYLRSLDRLPEAMAIYISILQKSPNDMDALLGTARVCESLGQRNEAISFCDRILSQSPSNENAIKLKRNLIQQINNPANSIEENRVYMNARDLLENDKVAEALDLMENHLLVSYNKAQLHNDIAVLAFRSSNYEKSFHHYSKAAEIEPQNCLYQKNLADFLHFIKKDACSALKIYISLLKSDPNDTELLYAIGRICVDMGHADDADTFFGRVLEIDPDHQDAKKALMLYQKIGPVHTKSANLRSDPFNRMEGKTSSADQSILVSAIVSVYNAERFLKGCLEDLLEQTIADRLEIIVVDSGSQQNEAAIVKRFQQQHHQIQYIRTDERETVYAAWNRGIKAARGEYITNANCDDRHKPDAFEIMSRTLAQRTNVALVYADCIITETENETFFDCTPVGRFRWRNWNRNDLLNRGCFMGPQPMWRRSLHDEYGYFDPDYITSGDYEFWLRISQTNDFYHIPQCLGLYLQSPQSIEHRNRNKQAVENDRLLKMYRKAASQKKIIRRQTVPKESPVERPADPSTFSFQKAVTSFECEHYTSAEQHLGQLLSVHPDHWAAYEVLVDVLIQSGQDMDIPSRLRTLENRADIPARMLALIGCGYEASGNLEKASMFVDQALALEPECARAWNLKGVLAYRNGQSKEAAQHFQKASELDESWGDPWTNMGTLHWEHGTHDKALQCFETGFQLSPTAPNTATTYHLAISETGNYKRARPMFEDAVLHHPDFRKASFFLIDILIRLEAYQEALNQIEAVLVRFGAVTKFMEAAKAIRNKMGPMTIKKGKHPSLSLCMIVKNEEKYLPRCLQSIKPMVDEMVVVDTGSVDATRDIAEIFGAKVFDFQWQDDFAAARNHSLDQALGDWILIMDADEVIAKSDHSNILDLVKKSKNNKSAYVLTTRNYTDRQDSADYSENTGLYEEERSTGWIPSKKVRLFRNHQGVHFVYPVHELVDPVLIEIGVSIIESPVPVHHYGKLDQARTSERWQTYYDIGHKKLASQSENDHALKELAIQAGLLSKWEEAATHWKSFIDRNPDSVDGYLNLTRVMANCGDYEQANQYANKAFQLAGDRSDTNYNLALSELQTGRAAKAAQTADRMVCTFPEDLDGKLLHALAEICAGKIDEGTKQLYKLSEMVPIVSLLPRIRSILGSIKSAGFDEWVVSLKAELSKVVNLKDTVVQPATTPAKKAGVIDKTTVGADENASTLFGKAVRDYEKENYRAAFDSLLHILSTESDHCEAYELLVNLMQQSGQDTDILNYLRPLEYRSNLPAKMMVLIGHGYEASGDLEKAAYFVAQAITIDPECACAWNLKGVIAYRNGHASEATQFFQKASECDPEWGDSLTNMGMIHWDQGSHDKALDCFEIGFQLSPTGPNVATTYHTAISETGQYDRARKVFEDVVSRHPDFRKGRFLFIDILIRLEAYPAALEQAEDVLVQFGSNSQFMEAAKAVRAKVGPLTIKKGKRPSLSLCMIVKNEEKYLSRCLKSLKPIVDEMIIVDTGSTDATKDIAEVFGAKLFDFEWAGDFAEARNHSLEKASGDWILVMDADEIIAAKDHKDFRKLLASKTKNQCAFMVLTRNYTDQYNIIGWEQNKRQYPDAEVGTGWIPSEKVRLFPNNKNIRFEYPVHELVSPSLKRMNISIVSWPYPVHHYGKLDQKKEVEKDLLYYTLGMKKLELVKDDPTPIREMAIQAHKLGKTEESIALWEQYIKLEPTDANSYVNISTSYMKLKQYADARKAAQIAVKLSPNLKTGHLNLGLSELLLGNVGKAKKIFNRIAKKHRDYFSAIFLLASSQLCQENIDDAAKTLKPLEDSIIWSKISYAILNLVESLSEAGQIELMRNLIAGSVALECSNKEIMEYHHRFKKEAA